MVRYPSLPLPGGREYRGLTMDGHKRGKECALSIPFPDYYSCVLVHSYPLLFVLCSLFFSASINSCWHAHVFPSRHNAGTFFYPLIIDIPNTSAIDIPSI